MSKVSMAQSRDAATTLMNAASAGKKGGDSQAARAIIRLSDSPVLDIEGVLVDVVVSENLGRVAFAESYTIMLRDARQPSTAKPLRFDINGHGLDISATIISASIPGKPAKDPDRARSLLGSMPILAIAELCGLEPATVANYALAKNIAPDYSDLFVHNGTHTYDFPRTKDVLKFSTVRDASETVARLVALMDGYALKNDRAGMHRVLEIALAGRDRALASGKREQAVIFAAYIASEMVKTGTLPTPPAKK